MPKFQKRVPAAPSSPDSTVEPVEVSAVETQDVALETQDAYAMEAMDEPDEPAEVLKESPSAPSVTLSAADLASAIVKATETVSGQIRKVPYGQHKITSAFNPTGRRDRALKGRAYQNGFRLNVKQLTDAEIELLNSGKLRSGRYLDRMVTVRIATDVEGLQAIYIDYPCKTADQRMQIGMRVGGGTRNAQGRIITGFENMLKIIIGEIDEADAAAKATRRREMTEALA
jgi:soluble cytochrome b562